MSGSTGVGLSGSAPYFLAFDFGTSRLRAAVGQAVGPPTGVASRRVEYYRPDGAPDAALEFNATSAWRLGVDAAKEAIHASRIPAASIAAIGVTGQRHGLVVLDEEGAELYAGPNKDQRAAFQGGVVDELVGGDLWDLTGHGPGLLTWWARLLWIREESAQLFERIRSACGIADWVAYRLTGELTLDSALAVDSGVSEVKTGQPADAISRKLGIDVSMFPPASGPGSVVGKLSRVAANQLSLPAGIPVVKAGPDTQTALVGMGVSETGHAGIATGWSTPVQCVTDRPHLDSTRTLWTGRHVVEDRWVVEGNSGVMGGAYDWLVSILGGPDDRAETMARLDVEAGSVVPGARGVAAHLGPSLVQYDRVGLRTGGLLFPVPLAFEPPDHAAIVRASLECFAFAIRQILDRIKDSEGSINTVSIGGGLTRSRTFLDVMVNVSEPPLYVSDIPDVTLLGAITLAAAAVDSGTGLESGLAERRGDLRQLEPSPTMAEEYRYLYDAWLFREKKLLDLEL